MKRPLTIRLTDDDQEAARAMLAPVPAEELAATLARIQAEFFDRLVKEMRDG